MTINQFINRHLIHQPDAIAHDWVWRDYPEPNTLIVYWRARALPPAYLFWREALTLPRNVNVVLMRQVRFLGWRITIGRMFLQQNTDGEFDVVGERCWEVSDEL